MKRLIAALVLTLSFSLTSFAAGWSDLAQELSRSVYRLSLMAGGMEVGTCTGFTIDQRVGKMLTAGHCVEDGYTVSLPDGEAVIELDDDVHDVAVVRFPGKILGPALHPGKKAKIGDTVIAVGHAYGWVRPVFILNTVAQSSLPYEQNEYTVITPGSAPGMSGGPVVDLEGRVVSIIQGGVSNIGVGVDISTIRDSTKKHWQYDR